MSNLAKIDFTALDISGKNYLTWVLNAEIHLQDRAEAMIFLRRHLHGGLKTEYLGVKDPA
ncbi:PREDICTED: zinc finger, partial [Prunus dulcis]